MSEAEKPRALSSRISTRISLRWVPDPASETTDTIVMSVKDWYVDLRMDTRTGEVDWAIAGQRLVESKEPLRVLFTHELDSHNAFEAVDCGTFTNLPNGDSLEKGSMPRYDLLGAPTAEYEEVWRELDPREGPDRPNRGISWILESDDGDLTSMEGDMTIVKTFLGCIWGTYISLRQTQIHTRHQTSTGEWEVRKVGRDVSARREEWDRNSGWREKYVVGKYGGALPSLAAGFDVEGRPPWNIAGQTVTIGGERFIVRAEEVYRGTEYEK